MYVDSHSLGQLALASKRTASLYIYNSVFTCRCIAINSSASAPLNAKKIAVKKVVDVVMSGLELNFLMYKFCILACSCTRQRAQRLIAELTLAQIREKLPYGWTDCHQLWHTCADSRQTNCPSTHKGGILGFLGGMWSSGKCGQTAGPIRNKFCTYNADESGYGHRLNKLAP